MDGKTDGRTENRTPISHLAKAGATKTVHGITVLVLYISSYHGPHLYHVWQKYQAISELWSQNALILFITKGHKSLNIIHGVKVLFTAHHLIMVYICTKFGENISNGF